MPQDDGSAQQSFVKSELLDKSTTNQDSKSSEATNLHTSNPEHDDLNPRSPKRRRISPPAEDDPFDIGAAAARAFALSMGGDVAHMDMSNSLPSAQRNESPGHPTANTASIPPSRSLRQIRVEKLSTLNDLALEILLFLARLNHLEIGEMLFGPPSSRGHEYRALKQKFDDLKNLYLYGDSPFLSSVTLDLKDAEQIDMLRRANLAIFMASIFSGEIGLRIMDINFVEVFVPEGGRLLKAQGSIYLELKTHAFMAATRTASTMLNQVMNDLFPPNMDTHLLRKRSGAKGLAPSEQDFLNRLASRRDILYSVIRSNKLGTLPDTYRWNDFAREVSIYLTKYMENDSSGSKNGLDGIFNAPNDNTYQQEVAEGQKFLQSLTNIDNGGQLSGKPMDVSDPPGGLGLSFDIQSMVAQAARAAALSMGDTIDMTLLPPVTESIQDGAAQIPAKDQSWASPGPTEPQSNVVHTTTAAGPNGSTSTDHSYTDPKPQQDFTEVPHSSQTAPTQVLYERARLVNTNKALSLKKSALPTHRRPWTTEEENALMTGLDEVKGPHWSQILAMYGPGGTINESLKDRNQVQLKDKARNLKLFFLKAGIEVPYYLQAVTGDLKTRAPGQAEKMERERMNGDSEKPVIDDDQVELNEAEAADDAEISLASDEKTPATQLHMEPINTIANQDFDIEAMIAQAAASVSKGLGPPASMR